MKQAMNSMFPQPTEEDDSWMMTTLAKTAGSFAGIFSIIMGVFGLLSLSINCIIGSVILVGEGLAMTLIEAPCFCIFLDFSQIPSSFFNNKPKYYKSITYLLFAFIPFTFCHGVGDFFSSAFMLITSGIYLMMSIGKKAPREQMIANATAGSVSTSPSAVLVANEQPMSNSKSMTSGLTGDVPNSVIY